MDSLFYTLLIICIACHLIRTIYSILKEKKRVSPKNIYIYIFMWINMLTLWITWFNLCELDPNKLMIPAWLNISGMVLFALGLLLFIIPMIQIRGVENVTKLCTTGVYKILRHPMYLGFILWVIGYPLFMRAQTSLIVGIFIAANILYWRYLEEKELLATYPVYAEYRQRTLF